MLDRIGARAWFAGRDLSPRAHLVLGLLLPAYVLAANMWRVRKFTVDDAYISFRYAANLAAGEGLVYNLGEPIEGYTNFLWTVLIAAGLPLGIDPHLSSKLLGASAALGTLWVAYRMSARAQPLGGVPCVATWLLAVSSTTSSWAVFGLETPLFTFLVTLGTWRMFAETEREYALPLSGLIFAIAGLTRPEAPLFFGLPMLFLGRRIFARQNLLRIALFALPIGAHLLWRHAYYGQWTPATFSAKTGDLAAQWKSGRTYVIGWFEHSGPVVFLAFAGVGLSVARRSRELLTITCVMIAVFAYVILVGGDWMSYFRFLAPAEPFVYVLVCVAVRQMAQGRAPAVLVALTLTAAWTGVQRYFGLREAQNKFIKEEKRFWDHTAGRVATWLVTHGTPGRVALGDIGFVGWRTNYPILDLLGLVDPVIARLPGGYTKKTGPGYAERFFDVMPEWAVLIHTGQECKKASLKAVRLIVEDDRFRRAYTLQENFRINADGSWCVFKRTGA